MWFVKETRGDVQHVIEDTVTGGGREKEYHEWQQSEGDAASLIERLSIPGEMVVDFFAGSGTTLVAAKRLGRRYVGFEINEDCADTIKRRLD